MSSGNGESLLSARTPKSISKSRRSSLVADAIGGSNGGNIGASMKISIQSMNLPNFDIHTLYKIKKRRSSSGDLEHHHKNQHMLLKDICIQDIRKEGLKTMLKSKIPLCYFLYHLLEEYSCENLFFFLELEQYDTIDFVSTVQQLATAQHIFDIYLSRNSQFEVNLDDKVRSDVMLALANRNVNGCFQTAKRAVYLLLESSFMQFVRTDIWNQMIRDCGKKKKKKKKRNIGIFFSFVLFDFLL
ncbi:RGS domain-containing protein [Halteromyces radiatus]|uniref:RGS domain-containing protein n=1 Tax=Halteromyces radiatus TaxID=101107 RepID=UPI00221E861C|nr:RGS domain-containing protein [Halteromyces radiatus]KAI8099718.1 RGS domain-containing protein [Halteromyces radiatus]